MPTYHLFAITIVFSNGEYAKIEMNCTHSIEAIKGALSLPSVIEKNIGKIKPSDIVKVECKKSVFKT